MELCIRAAKSRDGFVDKSCEDFLCSVCLCVPYFNDAVEATCCGSFFCSDCISRCRAVKQVCPNCNGSFTVEIPRRVVSSNKFAFKKINGLLVHCESIFEAENATSAEKCQWQGAWVDVSTHMARCEHTWTHCGWNYCKVSLPRRLLRDHEASCPFGTVVCEHCRMYMPQHELQGHHQKCVKYPVRCRCENDIERAKLVSHQMFDCTETVLWCSYAGCSIQIPRKSIQSHQEECDYRPTVCPVCSRSVPHLSLTTHTNTECPGVLVECSGLCGAKMLRSELPAHLSACLLSLVDCSVFGCPAKLQRKDIESHCEQSKDEHLKILSQQVSSLHQTVQSLHTIVSKQEQLITTLTRQHASLEERFNQR